MIQPDTHADDGALDYDDGDCPNCGGEGVVAHCWEEFACIDPESGCNDCLRRCDWCNPPPRRPPAESGLSGRQIRPLPALIFISVLAGLLAGVGFVAMGG